MSRVEVYIEDEGDSVAVAFRFMGEKPDPTSRAHQLANMIRVYLDEHLAIQPDAAPAVFQQAGATLVS